MCHRTNAPPIKQGADKLPAELVSLICSHLTVGTLKMARLINQTFSGQGARFLFKDVYFSLYQESMIKLVKIAKHPVFRNYVRRLYYCSEMLSGWYRSHEHTKIAADLREPLQQLWESWRLDLNRFRSNISHNKNVRQLFSEKPIQRYYIRAHHDYNDQRLILDFCSANEESILTILCMFPKLSSIEPLSQKEEMGYCFDMWSRKDRNRILSQLQKGTLQPHPFNNFFTRSFTPCPRLCLIGGFSRNKNNSRFFGPREIHRSVILHLSAWKNDKLLRAAFGDLIALRLVILVDDSESFRSQQLSILNSITIFAQSALNIRTLNLWLETPRHTEEVYPIADGVFKYYTRHLLDLSRLLDSLHLPHLRNLILVSFAVSENSLQRFIKRHPIADIAFEKARIASEPGVIETQPAWQRVAGEMALTPSIRNCRLAWLEDSNIRDQILLAEGPDQQRAIQRLQVYFQAIADFVNQKGETKYPEL